ESSGDSLPQERDEVIEAGIESFPATDPPAFDQGEPQEARSPGPDPAASEATVERSDNAQAPGPTTAQLRDEMPSGRTMGIPGSQEQAAAPLGTDDEAAGRPPGEEAVGAAMAQEARAALPQQESPLAKQPRNGLSSAMLIAVGALIVIALLWMLIV